MPELDDRALAPNASFLRAYWAETPFPLAFERTWECRILSGQRFLRPVLDLGCGDGLFARMLFRGPIDTGVDPNARELHQASKLRVYRELIQCSGDRVPKPDGSYRTVFSNSVLEHIPDLGPVLQEMYRLLVPGGSMYVTVPSNRYDHYTVTNKALSLVGLRTLAGKYRTFFNRFWHHYHYYRPAEWRALFERHGFAVVDCFTYGPRSLCVLNDFLVPFSVPAMILKKLLNRWTLLPALRRVLLAPLAGIGEAVAAWAQRTEAGGLVYLALRKPGGETAGMAA
jgi:SAM-dependent methyltransferase